MTKKIGVIGLPGKWSSECLADAAAAAGGGERHLFDMKDVWLDLDTQRVYCGTEDLCDYDILLVKKISETYSPQTLDRLELLRIVEQQGVRIFSKPLNILRLVNRLSCTVTLRQHHIPMPATRICEDVDTALRAIQDFGSAVFKPLYSTKARGMQIISTDEALDEQRARVRAFQGMNPSMYIQQKCELKGQDLGMVFMGGTYMGTYARVSQNDSWNTTIQSGGKYASYTASQDLINLAYKAQKPFNLDFTTVDVAITDAGPIVFEVSAFGGFRGVKEGIGIDAAARYVAYALEETNA